MTLKYTLFNPTPYEAHMVVWEKIKQKSRVLDVGCATGYFAQELNKKKCQVWGIERDYQASQKAKKHCQDVVIGDLEEMEKLPFKQKFFDYILLLDVLEHVKKPNKLLNLIKPYLKKNGLIIISVPNIAFLSIRLSLLFGRFEYKDSGLLDKNHLRFFTKKGLLNLIKSTKLHIKELDIASGFSQITLIGKYLNYVPKSWQYKISKKWDTLLAYQFIAECSKI